MEIVIHLEPQLPAHYSKESLHLPVICLWDSGAEKYNGNENVSHALVMWESPGHSYTSPCWKQSDKFCTGHWTVLFLRLLLSLRNCSSPSLPHACFLYLRCLVHDSAAC